MDVGQVESVHSHHKEEVLCHRGEERHHREDKEPRHMAEHLEMEGYRSSKTKQKQNKTKQSHTLVNCVKDELLC